MSRIVNKMPLPHQIGKPFVGKYSWKSPGESIRNVRSAISENDRFLWQRIRLVENGKISDLVEIEKTRDLLYALDSRKIKKLGLGRIITKDFKFFDGSHIQALIESFHKLQLNRFGFPIMWENLSDSEANEAVRYRVFKHWPDIKEAYLEVQNNPEDLEKLEDLKYMFYRLTQPDLTSYGLGTLTKGIGVRHFPEHKPSSILASAFHELGLNIYMFVGRTYDSIFEAEKAVRNVLFLNYPELEECFTSITHSVRTGRKLDLRKFNKARRIVKQVTSDELMQLGFSYLLNKTKFPGFFGSYKRILIRSFTILQLKVSDFDRTPRWRSTREARENVKRAVFKYFKGLKTRYRKYLKHRGDERFDLTILRLMVAIPVMSVTRRRLQKLGVNVTGKGAVEYFKGSVHRALNMAFSELDLPALREEFEEKGYDLGAALLLVEQIRHFEVIENFVLYGNSRGKTKLTDQDLAFLEKLVSQEFIEEINGAAELTPTILHLRFAYIRKILAPRVLRDLKDKH